MAAERLTQVALEHHDQILAKLHTGPDTTSRQRKESLAAVKSQNHLTSRRESTRRISNTLYEQSSSQSERKSSKSFLGTPSHTGTAMSVFRVLQAARTWRRFSHRHQVSKEKPKRQLENTYRLGPDPERAFSKATVKVVIGEVLNRQLKDFRYSCDDSKGKCSLISSEVLSLVKQMNFQRYKIVCNVIIMQNRGQGSEVASRCVWDPWMDSSVSLTHTMGDSVCVASVYAVYFE